MAGDHCICVTPGTTGDVEMAPGCPVHDRPSGEPVARALEVELADLRAETDGSVWSYSAKVGGFVSIDHPAAPVCRDAAAVIDYLGGDIVRPVQEER